MCLGHRGTEATITAICTSEPHVIKPQNPGAPAYLHDGRIKAVVAVVRVDDLGSLLEDVAQLVALHQSCTKGFEVRC